MKAVLLEFSLVFVAIHDVDASSAVGSRLRPTWQSGQGGSCRARQLRAQTFCAQALQFRVSCHPQAYFLSCSAIVRVY